MLPTDIHDMEQKRRAFSAETLESTSMAWRNTFTIVLWRCRYCCTMRRD